MVRAEAITKDERFQSLPFPIRNAGELILADPQSLIRRGTEFFGAGHHANAAVKITPQAEMQVVRSGRVSILAVRSTPCITKEEGDGRASTLAMPFGGGVHAFREGGARDLIAPGDIHLNPRNGGSVTVGYFSGLIAMIEHKQLERTMRVIGGGDSWPKLGVSVVLKAESGKKSAGLRGRFWSFMGYLDQLLGEAEFLPTAMGLDEQLYRLIAIALFEESGMLEKVRQRWAQRSIVWRDPLDELVDFIKANSCAGLTLTDLEEQSHYSARHLQGLFKEKFNCTPMQFVRRQRLSVAMERLQAAEYEETVTSVARDCGYRFVSGFSNDFHREFGVLPSTVLRASRGGVEIEPDMLADVDC